MWLHGAANLVIGLACLSLALVVFNQSWLIRGQRSGSQAWLTVAFLTALGLTLLVTNYRPSSLAAESLSLVTAIFAATAAIFAWPRLALQPRRDPSPTSTRAGLSSEPNDADQRDRQAWLTLAFGAAQIGVSEIDFPGQRLRMDARAAEMTGQAHLADTWQAMAGPSSEAFLDRIHPDDRTTRDAALQAVDDGKVEVAQMEYRLRREDGSWTYLTHWRSVVSRDPATNAPRRAVGVYLDTTDRAAAEAGLRDAVTQRDLLLREVYHRVKNNLQIVDGLLMLQAREVTDPAAVQSLHGLRSRIYALGLVHSQLMTSSNLETFDIAPFLQELTRNIVAGGAQPDIRLEVEISSINVDLDFAVPVGLLVTELITNSLKHAFVDGTGQIRVSLTRELDRDVVVLRVADNGRGGKAGAEKPRIGASIMAGLIRQLSATQTIRTRGGRSTTITIPFKDTAK